ncbi:hypothetical protein [Candidatus Protochlamydia phocaeensis]|uniref:hypothetical protein n=1 Tax=Candidatus Protochlamydia phocaeensis TaxID=1414722 RepID=UPI000837E8EA|nr:hypothetical protein [Candidatus Protochlamydia phocaeensis]
MIEKMLIQVQQYLPLKILNITWDGTVFQIYNDNWNFTTLSSWRISTKNKLILGCFDERAEQSIDYLKGMEIVGIEAQTSYLKIDPVFILSNEQRLEIFSTDTYEPWTFCVNNLGFYIATPGEPLAFEKD